jgi:serine/threonine-protein kinase
MEPRDRPSARDAADRLAAAIRDLSSPTADTDESTPIVALGASTIVSPGVTITPHRRVTGRLALTALAAAGAAAVAMLIITQAGPDRTNNPQANSPLLPGASTTPTPAGDDESNTSDQPPPSGQIVVQGPKASNPPGPGSPRPPAGTGPPDPTADPPTFTTINSSGGTVVAGCLNDLAYLESWEPAAGYVVQRVDKGPAPRARVLFRSRPDTVNIVVTCVGGVPQEHVTTQRNPPPPVATTAVPTA